MKKYIFIDFDGVLNTERHHSALLSSGKMPYDAYGPVFDPEAVSNLQAVVDATGAELVISSSWKLEGIERMIALWKLRRMPGVLAGCTPDYISGMDPLSMNLDNPDSFDSLAGKGNEIRQWLRENAQKKESMYRYVIFDDVPDFLPEQRKCFIEINPIVGITAEDAGKAIGILNGQ